MIESAALLVDEVLSRLPMRQWVLSFPFQLRFLFASRPEIKSRVLGIVYRAIETHLIQQVGGTRATAKTGAVTLIQRFGSALNLNIHFHMLFLDGVYLIDREPPVFRRLSAPRPRALEVLIETISQRVGAKAHQRRMSLYKRTEVWWIRFTTPDGRRVRRSTGTGDRTQAQEYHDRLKTELPRAAGLRMLTCISWGLAATSEPPDDSALNNLLGHSITYRIAVGPQAGRKAFTLQTVPAREPDHDQPNLAKTAGFCMPAWPPRPTSGASWRAFAATSPGRPWPPTGWHLRHRGTFDTR